MNKREAYRLGRERGYSIASWQDMPEIGSKVSRSIDWQGLGATIDTVEQAQDYFFMLCASSEENNRSYTPFEFTCKAFNEAKNSESLWEQFELGINVGYTKNWRERRHYYNE